MNRRRRSRDRVRMPCLWLLILGCSSLCPASSGGNADEAPKGTEEPTKETFKPRWFMVGGCANYWNPVSESEAEINKFINRPLGAVFPRWRKPRTFKDWSNEWRIRNGWLGFGRDINAHWSVYADMGGAWGHIGYRKKYYPLGVPIKIDIDFEHCDIFWETAVNYYPWKQPVYEPGDGKRGRMLRALRATRPYLILSMAYTHEWGYGRGRGKLPGVFTFFDLTKNVPDYLFWWNPQVAVETPITKNDSVNVSAGYMFHSERTHEYNTPTVGLFLRHKF
jgi:hypothetical protein